jgi:hypothetical protein
VDLIAASDHPMCVEVDQNLVGLEPQRPGAALRRSPAQRCPHAGHELIDTEGFRQIVVGAQIHRSECPGAGER